MLFAVKMDVELPLALITSDTDRASRVELITNSDSDQTQENKDQLSQRKSDELE